MAYIPLGQRPVTAVADPTGQNPGNWTAVLDSRLLSIAQPVFELYHLFIKSPTLVATPTIATVALNLALWDVTLIGQANSWDPAQPMLVTPGDTIYVMFNVPVTTTPAPVVTGWFRYQT